MQVAFQSDPDTFDPQVCYDATCWDNMQMLFDRLYDYKGATTDLESEAAASMPVISGGGKVYTIAIRKGMTFDNGKPVTAADFVYTFSRICNPATKSPVVSFWDVVAGCAAFAKNPVGSVSGIKALSTYSLQITLTQADAAFTYVLAMPHASVIPVGSGAQQALHPMGSGPFEMVSYTPGQSIILKANPNYWNKSLPYVTGVNEKLGVSPEVQLLELEKGQIDLMGDPLPNSDYLTVVGNKSLASQVRQRQSLDTYYLTLNTQVKPFNNPLVREAVSYAINRSFLLKLVNGQGSPATGFIPPGVTGYTKENLVNPLNVAKAKQLLKQAGYQLEHPAVDQPRPRHPAAAGRDRHHRQRAADPGEHLLHAGGDSGQGADDADLLGGRLPGRQRLLQRAGLLRVGHPGRAELLLLLQPQGRQRRQRRPGRPGQRADGLRERGQGVAGRQPGRPALLRHHHRGQRGRSRRLLPESDLGLGDGQLLADQEHRKDKQRWTWWLTSSPWSTSPLPSPPGRAPVRWSGTYRWRSAPANGSGWSASQARASR